MPSLLHSTTTQYPSNPTDQDYVHTPIVRAISSHEVEIDMSHFYNSSQKDHYIETVTLYSLRRIVDTVHFNKGDNAYKVIFDLNKINRTDRELSEINEWNPRNWKATDQYHVVVKCNTHGNWSDVSEEFL